MMRNTTDARQAVTFCALQLRAGRIDRATWRHSGNDAWQRSLELVALRTLRRAVRDYVAARAIESQARDDHYDDCQCRDCSLAWCGCGERAFDRGDRATCGECAAVASTERRHNQGCDR